MQLVFCFWMNSCYSNRKDVSLCDVADSLWFVGATRLEKVANIPVYVCTLWPNWSMTEIQIYINRIYLNSNVYNFDHGHTHTQPLSGLWSGTTRVGRYQKKHTHPDHQTSFINFLHLLLSTASSVFCLRAWQSSLITSVQVLFGLPVGLGPCTSYSMHFFTQSSSSFTTNTHTTAACSAVIPMLCHLFLISLSAPYLVICLLA